jgi:hypothetical protein
MELLGDVVHVESHFGLFGDSASVVQDRWTVCTKWTIDLEIILQAPDGIQGNEAEVEAWFSPFRDSSKLDAR